jgi:acetolactate synthase I/II/III large subunit
MTRQTPVKYSELLADWLVELGYTHCFFLPGGGSMHLLDGVRTRFTCIPTVHEVAAGIAAEYFNESAGEGKAFVQVTTGPGVTNLVTALAGSFLESRELLVIAGQVKGTDLASGGIRQRGIQEIDGVALAAPVCKVAERIERPVDRATFTGWVKQGSTGRPGPVFVEVCLDAQGAPVLRSTLETVEAIASGTHPRPSAGSRADATPPSGPMAWVAEHAENATDEPDAAAPSSDPEVPGPERPASGPVYGYPLPPNGLPTVLTPFDTSLPRLPAAPSAVDGNGPTACTSWDPAAIPGDPAGSSGGLPPGLANVDTALVATSARAARQAALDAVPHVSRLMARAQRPVWLIGGGVSRAIAGRLAEALRASGVPQMTTWNGADRIGADEPLNFGRPNTWGQRCANVLLQQADLVVVFGSRLGLQQTGYNWQEFVPLGKVVQCDIDGAELSKGHPRLDLAICGDANTLLAELAERSWPTYDEWIDFCAEVRSLLPLRDPKNETRPGYLCPYRFYDTLSELATPDDMVIPCSSGGANSSAMQALRPKRGQVIITDKGLASMGYGLAGALGAALAHPGRRTFLVEGDGGFSQNLQELATLAVNGVDVKIFLFCNQGYSSIRATQRNYFDGAYLGCDTETGLGFPDWEKLFGAYGLPLVAMDERGFDTPGVREALARRGPVAITVPIDPLQTGYPRIASRITESGSMESNPLHLMTPELDDELAAKVLRYFHTTEARSVDEEAAELVQPVYSPI